MNRPARPHPGGPRAAPARAAKAPTLHPRNRHQGRYDFTALLAQSPALRPHVVATPGGERSIDFSRPDSVRALNAALLRLHYGVRDWQIPPGYLCPPVPGRADYVHGLADLLAGDRGGTLPRGPQIRALDIGTGANLIYPLIGHAEYGWQFVASDIDRGALDAAARILDRNPDFRAAIELRLQPHRGQIFAGLLREGERFDLSLCNPPFHASAREAAEGSQRKWRNLGRASARTGAPLLNFGGQSNELWCPGGEAAFLQRMIDESARIPGAVGWFSSLVAKSEHLRPLRTQLQRVGAREVREVAMAQGSKQSRFLAWTFLAPDQRIAARA